MYNEIGIMLIRINYSDNVKLM